MKAYINCFTVYALLVVAGLHLAKTILWAITRETAAKVDGNLNDGNGTAAFWWAVV